MTFERNPNMIQAEVKVMWPDGPSRMWSAVRCGGAAMPQENGGFAGSYVCQACEVPVAGVYRVFCTVRLRERWLCAACRTGEKANLASEVA